MAIYGLGAIWNKKDDHLPEFLGDGVAAIGWDRDDAPSLYALWDRVRMLDVIYIKSFQPNESGLRIKAVGLVMADERVSHKQLGKNCVRVRWIWRGERQFGLVDMTYNVRNCTFYEELFPEIRHFVSEKITESIRPLSAAAQGYSVTAVG